MTMTERVKLLDCDCIFSGPLSRDTHYALYVSGPVRRKEIDNLIKVLELQREWLTHGDSVEGDITDSAQAAPMMNNG